MFDIEFYMKTYELKQQLMNKIIYDKNYVWNELEKFRNPQPVIYNIETTNACNMKCVMCPRTTMMNRSVKTMEMDIFQKIIDQIKPFSQEQWQKWQNFAENNYHISRRSMSENHFFLYVISRVLALYGYGDPLLDKNITKRIKLLNKKKIPSYFSCNPANINIEKSLAIFESGLDYIKYSIDSVNDLQHKAIRGQASNFTESYTKIIRLLELKEKYKYKTTIVITMLNLNRPDQEDEFEILKAAFKGRDVYIYLKSQDQQWYQDVCHGTKSVHWIEFCQFPWSSMTIKSNGEAVQCVMDYNNEIILGDVRNESLQSIWNGIKYKNFRKDHFNLTDGMKCTERCDMTLVGDLIKGKAYAK